jgi:hypothetical protein
MKNDTISNTFLIVLLITPNIILFFEDLWNRYKMSSTKDCSCNLRMNGSKSVEYFKINGSRIELRCGNCNGLVNWWVEHPRTRNIVPVKRGWFKEECESMR